VVSHFFIIGEHGEEACDFRLMLEELALYNAIVDIELLDGLLIVGYL
jgi:hypothetical protein